MSNYPPFQRERSVRLGAIVCAVLLVLLVAAAGVRHRKAAWWQWQPPLEPGATTPVEATQSRLLHARTWSYRSRNDTAAVQTFYAEALAEAGWQAGREVALPHGRARRYVSGGLTLDVRTETTDEGETDVGLLLTDVPPPSEG